MAPKQQRNLDRKRKTNLVVVVALFGQPDFHFALSEISMGLV